MGYYLISVTIISLGAIAGVVLASLHATRQATDAAIRCLSAGARTQGQAVDIFDEDHTPIASETS